MSATLPLMRLRTEPGPHARPVRVRLWVLIALLWLAVLQVGVPMLGAMHQVVHQSHGLGSGSASASVRWAPDVADAAAPLEFSARLFGGHSAADCQLFDQMSSGAGLLPSVPSQPIVSLPMQHAPWSVQALLLRKSPALFFARGPPQPVRA